MSNPLLFKLGDKLIRILINIIVVCFSSILLSFLYYVFFSYSKYNGKAEIIPSPIFPMFVGIAFTIGMIYARYLLKTKLLLEIGVSIILVFLFIMSSNYINMRYGYILQHYYQSTPHTNLLNLTNYSNQKGNYFIIINKLNKRGYEIDSLYGGNNDKYEWPTSEEDQSYSKMIYYVNNQFYVIFDWVNRDIMNFIEKEKLEDIFIEKMSVSNPEKVECFAKYIRLKQNDGKSVNYKIIPNKNNGFDFIKLGS